MELVSITNEDLEFVAFDGDESLNELINLYLEDMIPIHMQKEREEDATKIAAALRAVADATERKWLKSQQSAVAESVADR